VIDDNCHPFALSAGPLDLADMSLDVHPDEGCDQRRHAWGPWRVGQEALAARLGDMLGCSREELPAARAEASANWPRYASRLFADAQITDLVMDVGYPPGADSNIESYQAVSGCRVHPVFRFETVVDAAIADGMTTTEIWNRLRDWMTDGAARCAGFKAFIAYRTGLAVQPAISVGEADRSLRGELPVRRRGKACRDLLLQRALGLASELGLPVHIHAGIGDSDLRMAEADPLLLEPLLDTKEGSAAKVVIIHGAYPFHEELAYLAATRSRVWADLSMSNLYAPTTFGARLLAMLDLAPAEKLLLGTDGHDQPEIFWYGAWVLRTGWQLARRHLEEAGARPWWIDAVQQRLFAANARAVYDLTRSLSPRETGPPGISP
jgi:hypothetical protein